MQTILNDPYINNFLKEVTPNQQMVTLKELIYIGIKVVNSSLTNNPQLSNNHNASQWNKENKKRNVNSANVINNANNANYGNNSNFKVNKNQKKKLKKTQNYQSKTHLNKYKNTSSQVRIQSNLLREISKIRTQLESLTNQVYDHCFDEPEYCQSQSSISLNNDEEIEQAHGFHHSNAPTFSANQAQNLLAKAFQKQGNNFFVNGDLVDAQNKNASQQKITEDFIQNRQKRVLSKHHLDDTQIRKALYHEPVQQNKTQNLSRVKSKPVIVQKQTPVHYFQKLDPKQIKEEKAVKKSRKVHNLDNNCGQTVKATYKQNVKSKIKSLVQRDRLRYQQNVRKQEFVKGFNKYEYSDDNEFDDDEDQNQGEFGQNYQGSPQIQAEQRSAERGNSFQQNKSNPKFQFYGSNERYQKKSDTFKDDFVEGSDNINIGDNSSSFSQFSISGSSKREVGKISRRNQQ